MPISCPTKPHTRLCACRGITVWLMLVIFAGCSTHVRAPFEVSETETASPAAQEGPLADLELALQKRIVQNTAPVGLASVSSTDISGFYLLDRSEEALRWRLALIDSATETIDLQYYLYHSDNTGMLLTSRLLAAADRGVRIRVIIDDMGTLASGKRQREIRDTLGKLIGAHPNISFRLFNSAENRKSVGWGIEFATNFAQLNHRMHNKSLIADNRAVILGGRNIGDEYMGLGEYLNFRDIDVLGVGPISRQTSAVFDLFWNSGWAIPVSEEKRNQARAEYPALRKALATNLEQSTQLEAFSLAPKDWDLALRQLETSLHLGSSEVITDRPTTNGISTDLLTVLFELLPQTDNELLITNAYFIPDDPGIEMLEDLEERGVDVTVHTNSLASQDVVAVNSHYKMWRGPLLDAGVRLYEARHDAAIKSSIVDTAPVSATVMGLHSKSLVIDRRLSVIGSANFDPRSALINSEMFAVIDSEGLANQLAKVIERDVTPANSWRVERNQEGAIYWSNGNEIRTKQPSLNVWQRFQDMFFKLFPKRLY